MIRLGDERMIEELFASVGLFPRGPVAWNLDIPEAGPGVYVIVRAGEVVYVDYATRSLAQRLQEVYRQQYGPKALYREDEASLALKTSLHVYWALTDDPRRVGAEMLRWLSKRFGYFPIGNRK